MGAPDTPLHPEQNLPLRSKMSYIRVERTVKSPQILPHNGQCVRFVSPHVPNRLETKRVGVSSWGIIVDT